MDEKLAAEIRALREQQWDLWLTNRHLEMVKAPPATPDVPFSPNAIDDYIGQRQLERESRSLGYEPEEWIRMKASIRKHPDWLQKLIDANPHIPVQHVKVREVAPPIVVMGWIGVSIGLVGFLYAAVVQYVYT